MEMVAVMGQTISFHCSTSFAFRELPVVLLQCHHKCNNCVSFISFSTHFSQLQVKIQKQVKESEHQYKISSQIFTNSLGMSEIQTRFTICAQGSPFFFLALQVPMSRASPMRRIFWGWSTDKHTQKEIRTCLEQDWMDFSLDVTGLALVQFSTSNINNAVLKCRPGLSKPHILFRLSTTTWL